jgi:diguanylate cyclase (GGDEF)-like protein
MTEPAIVSVKHGRRFTFTSIVTGMVLLLLAIVSISLPAIYLTVHLQYQHGQVDSESEANADAIADRLEEHPDWLITNPALERYTKEDHVFKEADGYETRAILSTNGRDIFAKHQDEPLAWPVVSHRSAIKVDGKAVGYFVLARSLTHFVYETIAIFITALFGSALIVFLLHRFVLHRLRLIEDDLSRNARFDALTGLPNRREAIAELQRRLALNQHGATAVFFIDLDKFKAVNDSYGHAVGDAVLKASASRLRSCIRPEDFLGRLAGDEFIILLSISDGEALIKRVSESISHAFLLSHFCLGHEVAITATVGIALAPKHGNQPELLIQHADTAMYTLKSTRRGGWKIYEPAMTEKVEREVHLRAKLKQALPRQEFELHYQPLIRLHDNKTIGAEALIRWRDSESGHLIAPSDFISELEQSGLIVPVGEWVLRTACRQVAEWRRTLPHFHIAVNVSGRQFIEDGFVNSVARILLEEKVEPGAIELELTESMLLDDALTTRKLAQLKSIGVRLALDDFGTGFSSLGRLASMPFDVIKIDRSFIDQMNVGERERSVVVAIIALSHGLGMTVLSEGIEQAEQRQALVELGCERGQGFLFSRPILAETFNAIYIGAGLTDTAHGQSAPESDCSTHIRLAFQATPSVVR